MLTKDGLCLTPKETTRCKETLLHGHGDRRQECGGVSFASPREDQYGAKTMGPVAGRTAAAGDRNSAGPSIGAGKRVVAAAGAGRRAKGPGRVHTAAVGRGLGRNRAARVLVSCFCKASLDYRKRYKEFITARNYPIPPVFHPSSLDWAT